MYVGRKGGKGRLKKRRGDVMVSDMWNVGVSEKDAKERVKWKYSRRRL